MNSIKGSKKCLILLLLFLSFYESNALVSSYSFTTSSFNYTPISGGVVLGNSLTDNQRFVDPNLPLGGTSLTGPGLPIGFNFFYDGISCDKFAVNANGWISVGTGSVSISSGSSQPISSAGGNNAISAFGVDIQSQVGASLSYLTIGNAPNRTLVIQWENYKKHIPNGNGDTINFQIHLDETSNTIKFIYGKLNLNSNAATAQVGLRGLYYLDFNNRLTTTNWLLTSAGSNRYSTCDLSNSVYPPINTSFIYTSPAQCVAPPTGGNTISSANPVCSNLNFTLSLINNSQGAGITYQWQHSNDSLIWIDIIGANSDTFATTQTSANFYRCVLTCSGTSTPSIPLKVAFSPCYCASSANISTFADIGNVTFSNLYNGIANPVINNIGASNTYSNYTSLPPAILERGVIYPISVSQISSNIFFSSFVTVFIDFDQDGSFSTNETFALGTTNSSAGGNEVVSTIQIPINAALGTTRMRISLVEGSTTIQSPCSYFTYGEVEDYSVNITPGQPCTLPVFAGIAVADNNPVCSNSFFTLLLNGASQFSTLTYQWQKSPDTIIWTNILNASSKSLTVSQQQPTFYRCLVTCSGITDTSAFVYVNLTSNNQCYCLSGATYSGYADIGNIKISTLDNGAVTNAVFNLSSNKKYSDYSYLPATPLVRNKFYKISVTQIDSAAFFPNGIGVFIDFDQSGDFNSNETFILGYTVSGAGGNTLEDSILIPTSSAIGLTRMRIVLSSGSIYPCGSYVWGETEDYTVLILPDSNCNISPNSGTISSINNVCPGTNFTLNLIGNSVGLSQYYQWEVSSDTLNWTSFGNASLNSSIITSQNIPLYYRCKLTCGNFNSYTPIKFIAMQPISSCNYCIDIGGGSCPSSNKITQVVFAGLFNNSDSLCNSINGTSLKVYPISVNTSCTLNRGSSYLIGVTTNKSSSISVWIDFNQNNSFDSTEWTQISIASIAGVASTALINIPNSSIIGYTRMRIRTRTVGTNNGSLDACTYFDSGETEDYFVNIDYPVFVHKLNSQNDILIVPNPVHDYLGIVCQGYEGEVQLSLINIFGQVCYTDEFVMKPESYRINISKLGISKGVYICQLIMGQKIISKKIIIE